MANTTNYNWETPDDTDLVKDGAAAIRTLGNSIDTTTKALNPETTLGDIAYRSSTSNTNTRLPIGSNGQILGVSAGVPAWINNDQGDITEVQAGVGISISSGTGPIPVITNSSTDLITTAGDILYGTAADTVARLGIGTAGQVLKVNSGATAPEWGAASAPAFVGCTAYRVGSNLSVPASTPTAVLLPSEEFDTDSFHSTSTNTSRMTIPSGKNGKYLLVGSITFDNIAVFAEIRFYKNGSAIGNGLVAGITNRTTSFYGNLGSLVVDAVATDYFEMFAFQSNVTQNLTDARFSIIYLGA